MSSSSFRRRKPTAVDLFSGCGGLTLGLKHAGFSVRGAVEIDHLAAETYRMNHPSVVLWHRDISSISGAQILRRLRLDRGELDLLAGCPPCQGYSSIRTLNGGNAVEDERNDLIFEFLRLVEELSPKSVMLENVPSLANDARLHKFRRQLRRLGYTSRFTVLNAADYGVPQRRRRLILIARRGHPVKPAPAVPDRRTVRDAISTLPAPGTSGDSAHDLLERRSDRILELIRAIPRDGGSRVDLGPERQLACHQRSDGFKDIYGRIAWDEVAPTITGGCINPSKGRFLHPVEDRAITLREAALLQSFPSNYRFSLRRGKYAAAEMIGNALPPIFVMHHAKRIAESLRNGR